MENSINYDTIAPTYAQTRQAVPWVVAVLQKYMTALPNGSVVIELGCGTGNHSRALAETMPQHYYAGFDQSIEMLKQARAQSTEVIFSQGDAQRHWPYANGYADLVFNIDVIHYIQNLTIFFREAQRVLKRGGSLLIATDSDEDLQNRSLTTFFPESLAYELARYPKPAALYDAAIGAGLRYHGAETIQGTRTIDDDYLARLTSKCSSALRLISDSAHQRGLERVRQAQARGELWYSLYTVYRYTNQ
ncbi:MAG: methyltransferase domain-containing protein [Caldilineaceae bacterium]|nr:methyltransferase domain-containing protein [Caldilineaceae bacterium]